MSWAATFWVKKECEVSNASERLLLILIADISADDGFGCWQGLDSLSFDSKIEKTTLMRVIKRLEQSGELIVARHLRPGRPKKGESEKSMNYYALVMGRPWLQVREQFAEYLSDGRGVDLTIRSFSDAPEHVAREYREEKGVDLPPFDPTQKGSDLPPFSKRKGAPIGGTFPGQKGAKGRVQGAPKSLERDIYINTPSEVNNAGAREATGENFDENLDPAGFEKSPSVRQGISELRRKMHGGEPVRTDDQSELSGDASTGPVAVVG